jgi:hypothetical protein
MTSPAVAVVSSSKSVGPKEWPAGERSIVPEEPVLLVALDLRVRVPGLPVCRLVALSLPMAASFPPE